MMDDRSVLNEIVKELREALIVDGAMLMRHEQRQKEHDDWLRSHELAIAAHDKAMSELDKKLDRIADMMGFRPGNGNK